MKKAVFLLMFLLVCQINAAQTNPSIAPVPQNPNNNQTVPSNNKNVYDANSNSHYNSVPEIRNVKVQPTNAGNNIEVPTNTGTQAAGTADSPGTGSNRAAGNISSGNTPVSDPTRTNSTIPENRNNSPRP